jgi:hypothetical protein
MAPKKAYWGYKNFDSLEEMFAYIDKFPSLRANYDYFRRFFEDRLKEIQFNIEINPNFTFLDAFQLLRLNTDWCEGDSLNRRNFDQIHEGDKAHDDQSGAQND